MSFRRRTLLMKCLVAAVAALAGLGAAATIRLSPAVGASLGQLNSELGAQQAHQQSLSANLSSLSQLIASLDAQISLVQSREAAVRSDLDHDRAALALAQASLARELARLVRLRARLAHARMLLSRQLLSSYESDKPDLVAVVLNAHGFTDLLEKLDFLHRAEQQQQTIISITKDAKAQADSSARRLAKLETVESRITQATAIRVNALAGMNALLQSRQAALAQARAAQQAALNASRARGHQLQAEIAQVQAQQAAAQAAANAAAPSSAGPALAADPSARLVAPGFSCGWAIPYAIVLCESGGQNVPPNSAGASGYYQIIPSTWSLYGGTGPAAYLASKGEQDAVASRIWNGGAGASNWVCAGIVGIH